MVYNTAQDMTWLNRAVNEPDGGMFVFVHLVLAGQINEHGRVIGRKIVVHVRLFKFELVHVRLLIS